MQATHTVLISDWQRLTPTPSPWPLRPPQSPHSIFSTVFSPSLLFYSWVFHAWLHLPLGCHRCTRSHCSFCLSQACMGQHWYASSKKTFSLKSKVEFPKRHFHLGAKWFRGALNFFCFNVKKNNLKSLRAVYFCIFKDLSFKWFWWRIVKPQLFLCNLVNPFI